VSDGSKDKMKLSLKFRNPALRKLIQEKQSSTKSSEEFLNENITVVEKSSASSKTWIVVLVALFLIVFIYENLDHLRKPAQPSYIVSEPDPEAQPSVIRKNTAPLATRFYQAVSRSDINQVQQYLNELAPGEINTVIGGMTPVMKAASVGKPELVELLIKHGADPNKRGSHQRTALQYAAEKNRLAVAKVLLKHGADINGTDNTRLSPLTMAADRGYHDLAMYLIDKGADVNIQHTQGWTALIDAARNGDLLLVKRLVEAGADLRLLDKQGRSALDFARNNNHQSVEAYLLEQYEK
jgi:ankyrin repeat protein